MNGQINFSIADIEQLMWNAVLETFQQAMVEVLSTLDVYLMATRDKSRYEYKEIKERNYVTMVGSIDISRRYYWDKQEKKWVFLLDQALELAPREQISACLKELVVFWGTKGPSYRDARDRLKLMQKTAAEQPQEVLEKAIVYCLERKLYSAVDCRDAALWFSQQPPERQAGVLPNVKGIRDWLNVKTDKRSPAACYGHLAGGEA